MAFEDILGPAKYNQVVKEREEDEDDLAYKTAPLRKKQRIPRPWSTGTSNFKFWSTDNA